MGINIGVGWEGGGRKKKVFRHAQGRFRRDNQGLCTHRRMVASLHRHYIDCACLLPSTSLILHPGTGQSSTCLRDLKTVLSVCVWVLLVNKSTDTSWLPTNWRLFTFPSWFGPVESCCGHMVVNQCGKCTYKCFKEKKEGKKERSQTEQKNVCCWCVQGNNIHAMHAKKRFMHQNVLPCDSDQHRTQYCAQITAKTVFERSVESFR